jgi:glycosyltransferase involved in cell wall biosynthesis
MLPGGHMKKVPTQTIGNYHPNTSLREYPRRIGRKIKFKLKNLGKSRIQHRSFRDFSGFLSNSLISPMVYAPFREQDKRCFATMENIAKHLIGLSKNIEDKTLVSVIMPVFNREDTLKYAVDSVLEQSYKNIELIIVNDGSEDGSKVILENIKDPRVRVLHNNTRKGVSNARNQGLKAANGYYIAYLDSDNRWDSRYLAAMVGAFIELPDAEVIYSGQILFKGQQKYPFAVRYGSFNRSLLENRNYIDINSLCHTHDLYNRIGGFDESLVRLVDYDLIMRMAEKAQTYSVPVLLSYYYYDNASNTITNIPGYVHYLKIVRDKRKKRAEDNLATTLNLNLDKISKHNVSIIIPSYEALDDIRECIDSIKKLNKNNFMEIIVVDNDSKSSVVDYLNGLHDKNEIKLIKNDLNYGFTYAANQGIEIAEPENDIVLLNNDAILTGVAIEAMQNAAYELHECGIVVPQQVLPGNTKTINEHVPFAYPQYECDVNLSNAHANIINVPVFHSGRVVELSFAPFFCVYIKREVLNNSVGLDPEYGRHYRSDRIFCNYLRHMMNLKVYYIQEAVVYHKLQKSTDELRDKPNKGSNFDIMFSKNQWDPEHEAELGYKTPIWDF